MRSHIEKFFARYGAALSSDDVQGIVSCFDPPTVVIDDATTTLMIDRAQLEAHFTGMANRYRARGAFTAVATVRGVEQLASALWLVDVRWDSLDEAGEPAAISAETYRYLVRAIQPDEPLIVAAVVTG
jgi:hypothetical protein